MFSLPYLDRLWTARGQIDLVPPGAPATTFAQLAPLLAQSDTQVTIDGPKLSYVKDNPGAQDQLATFSRGEFEVCGTPDHPRLTYRLVSPALMLVFLAPLFFLAIAQATEIVIALERPTVAEKAKMEKEKAKMEKKAAEEGPAQLNPIDQWLGAPRPETLEEKKLRELEEETDETAGSDHSPGPAYVLAGIFAVLYLFGRWFEPFLVRRRLRTALHPDQPASPAAERDGLSAAPPTR